MPFPIRLECNIFYRQYFIQIQRPKFVFYYCQSKSMSNVDNVKLFANACAVWSTYSFLYIWTWIISEPLTLSTEGNVIHAS